MCALQAEPASEPASELELSPEEEGALLALLPKQEAEQRRVKLPLPCAEAHVETVRQWEARPLVVTKEEVLAEAVKQQPEAAANKSPVSTWGPPRWLCRASGCRGGRSAKPSMQLCASGTPCPCGDCGGSAG